MTFAFLNCLYKLLKDPLNHKCKLGRTRTPLENISDAKKKPKFRFYDAELAKVGSFLREHWKNQKDLSFRKNKCTILYSFFQFQPRFNGSEMGS